MKYQKLTAVLGLAQISLSRGALGLSTPTATFSEEDLEKVEQALAQGDAQAMEALQQEVATLKEELATAKEGQAKAIENVMAVEVAVSDALETAGLQAEEEITGSIALLGAKCKEYGNSKERHSFPDNNGKEENTDGLIEGYFDPNDEHNQYLKGTL